MFDSNESEHLFRIRDVMSAAMFFRRQTYAASGGFDELLFEYAKTAEDQGFAIE